MEHLTHCAMILQYLHVFTSHYMLSVALFLIDARAAPRRLDIALGPSLSMEAKSDKEELRNRVSNLLTSSAENGDLEKALASVMKDRSLLEVLLGCKQLSGGHGIDVQGPKSSLTCCKVL